MLQQIVGTPDHHYGMISARVRNASSCPMHVIGFIAIGINVLTKQSLSAFSFSPVTVF